MSSEGSSFSVERHLNVDLPTPEGERTRAIRTVDWYRCKRKVASLLCPSQKLSKLYSTFTGATITTGISWIVHRSLGIDMYIVSMYFWASVCFAILAISLYIMEREQIELFTEKRTELITDMNEIESTFLSDET